MTGSRFFLPPKISAALNDLLFRYIVFVSGRGCAKTWSTARWLLGRGTQDKIFIGCFREWMNSIKESNHRVLKQQIELMGLGDFYDVGRDSITGANGTEFAFAGLRTDPRKVKGMEGMDFAWVDEAAKVPKESWGLLGPTLFRNSGARMIVSFNPEDEEDPSSQMFIVKPIPGSKLVRLTQADNPFFTKEMLQEMEHAYATDPETAAHIWGGEFRRNSDAQILRGKYIVEDFTPGCDWSGPYFGADFGLTDPNVLMKLWIHQRKLFVEYEASGSKVELMELADLWSQVPGSRRFVKLQGRDILAPQQPEIRCDNSRPETIGYMRNFGFNAVPAKKWPGSVEEGIVFLRNFDQIVIHSRCKGTEQEFRLYSYKVDRLSGQVLSVIVDRYNHRIDAIRYALEPIITQEREGILIVDSEAGFAISSDLDALDAEVARLGF